MLSFHRLAILAFTLSLSALHAAPGLVISLDSIGDRVRAQNPDLAAARLRIREALGRMKQAGRLPNPDLQTEVGHDPRMRERKLEIGFSQRFPMTDRLRLEKEISATELKASEAEVRDVERRIIAEARQGVIQLLALRHRRDLLRQQAALSTELTDFLTGIAAKGEGSALDAAQAKLESAGLTLEMRQLDASEAAALGALKPLLGMTPGESLIVSGSLPFHSGPRGAVNHGDRPDYQVAALEAAAAEKGVTLEQAKKYEDVEAGIFASAERTEDAPQGYDHEALLGVRLRIPLPLWNKNEGAIEEAQARKERKHLEATALARSIHLEAETARAEMAEWAKLIDELSGTLIPLADEQAAAAERALRSGQGEIQSVFRSREKRLQLSTARLDALREFHLARVRYEAAVGSF